MARPIMNTTPNAAAQRIHVHPEMALEQVVAGDGRRRDPVAGAGPGDLQRQPEELT